MIMILVQAVHTLALTDTEIEWGQSGLWEATTTTLYSPYILTEKGRPGVQYRLDNVQPPAPSLHFRQKSSHWLSSPPAPLSNSPPSRKGGGGLPQEKKLVLITVRKKKEKEEKI